MWRTAFCRFNSRVFLFLFLLISATSVLAQTTSSPYSRYGIGDFQGTGGAINTALGGGIGYSNDSLIPQYINLLNPASLTSHGIIAYEASLVSNTAFLSNTTTNATFNRTSLGHIALAFPVKKWWGASIGLMPYSSVGYNVASTENFETSSVTYRYEGSGGTNQVFMGHGFRPFAGLPRRYRLSEGYEKLNLLNDTTTLHHKMRVRNNLANFSIGFTAAYMFGSINNVRRDVFPDTLQLLNTKISKSTTFSDVYLSYGAQYSFRIPWSLSTRYQNMPDSAVCHKSWFKNEYTYTCNKDSACSCKDKLFVRSPGIRVTIGAIFTTPQDIAVTYDLLAQTYRYFGTQEIIRDTVTNLIDQKGQVQLPAMMGFGISLKRNYKWVFQADWMTQAWADATYLGQNLGLKNSQRMSAGFQFQPQAAGRGKYMGAVQYRLAARYHQTYLELRQTQLTEYGVSFGMAMPMPYRTRLGEPVGRLSWNVEAGRRGTTDNGLIQENYIRATFGITINDRWFNRVRYD